MLFFRIQRCGPTHPIMHKKCHLSDASVVISSAADVRKQALVFEKKVGDGRLFVSNCIYKEDNAGSVALMDGIINYVQSRKFKPRTEMSMDILKELAEPSLPVEPGNLLKNASFEERHHLKINWLH